MTTPEERIEFVFNGLKHKRRLPDSIDELKHFSFTDFADARSKITSCDYIFLRGTITSSLFDCPASRKEKLVCNFSTLSWVLGALVLLTGSFLGGNLYILLGYLLFPVLLLFTTNQFERIARFVLFVLAGGSILALANGNVGFSILFASLSMWLFGHLTVKTNYYRTLYRQALNNEKAFILALWSQSLGLADKNMTEVWTPPKQSQV